MTVDRLALPVPPAAAPAWRFPIVAVVAPVVVSIAIWLITGSMFALIFAALGPVTAIASVIDQRLTGRRTRRREAVRFRADIDAAAARISQAHAEERAARDEEVPDGAVIVSAAGPDRGRWRYRDGELSIALGRGSMGSGLETDPVPRESDEESRAALEQLVESARTLDGPVTVDARLGIGVCGPRRAVLSVVRGLVVQCARALPPDEWWLSTTADEDWIGMLPHQRRLATAGGFRIEFGRGSSSIVIAAAPVASALPAECRVVFEVASGSPGRVVEHPDRLERRAVRPVYVTARDATDWARAMAEEADRAGLVAAVDALPAAVALAPLLRAGASADDRSLACEVGVGAAGAVTVDLVAHGPHAVVGGTTGSGKSELLVSWVVAMAAAHPPDRVTVLLVDFKGGSAFAPLVVLPHTVGIITDLDAEQAERALSSLRAELRYRERELARSGARSIEESALPRLVIIVDEFAAMLVEHPDLHALFGDIAARGRSLGLHLVLCTQRPAAAVRDGVLANADLRISLRVNNPADSHAVVGAPDAADLDGAARGRAVLRLGAGEPQTVQIALAADGDAHAVAERWARSPRPRRPWCDPLPAHVTAADLETGAGITLGLLDLPEEQRRATAHWIPEIDGHLLVLGAPRSGRSTALAALGVAPLPADPLAAWDALTAVVAALDEPRPAGQTRLVVIDDIDVLVPRFAPDHRLAWLDLLARVLREGASRGIVVALSAHRLTGELGALSGLVPSRLMLRHASRQDWLLAGGDGSAALTAGPPGAGRWQGHRIQVVAAAPIAASGREVWDALDPERPLAVATTRAASVAASLAAAGWAVLEPAAVPATGLPSRSAVVGDVDEWQSRWGALGALRATCEIVLEGCSPADVRALTRSRALPPPLPAMPGACWHLRADGTLGRARLPAAG